MIIALAAGLILAQAADSAAPPAKSAAPAKDPIVCRSEMPIGSRLPQKTCMPKSERDRLKRESRKRLEDIQTAGSGPFKPVN
ncbi:hypothetical protein [Phenylobacterium sp.]|uniref:hypothetical protein n=1 Tax=Phenylobacterium sp. TaxID=1871053 RepID=UPI0025D077E6|nr:hypothetical protein [Phenylobacterium sp.]